MNIRSITYFLDSRQPIDEAAFERAGDFDRAARPAFEKAGYEVQTTRLATAPFPRLLPALDAGQAADWARKLETAAQAQGYDYISLGPALPDYPDSYRLIPEMLSATQNAFLSGLMTTAGGGVSLPAVQGCADVIQRAATVTPDGFTNLRFAALANVPPGSPFFPAAYHHGNGASFALATEAADLAVSAFGKASSLEEAQSNLVAAMESHAQALTSAAQELTGRFGIHFGGIDFSLAPYPEAARSLGAAMERLGVVSLGHHGSLAAAAILAGTIDRARFPRAGFSGLMLPVLEDAILAARAAQGTLGIKDMLLYSAVCGTGLDTIPLPGGVSKQALAALLLDLAALAQRLDKPLTARLMPIPGAEAGDPTDFDFSYFANSRVLDLPSAPLQGLLASQETFSIHQR
jgi:uncharacterized protein (UPF0210 family)